MNTEDVKKRILELCSDDDFGSWEIWWYVSELTNRECFIRSIKELLDSGLLVCKKRAGDNRFPLTVFSEAELNRQLDCIASPENSFYWFGIPSADPA